MQTITADARTTVAAPSGIDPTVAPFPAAIDMPIESGVPVVWAYNQYVTGTVVVIDGRPLVTSNRVTRSGNIEATPMAGDDRVEVDDRWRIDLRTDAGFAFALRVLARKPALVMAVSEFDLLTWKNLVGKVTDTERQMVIAALKR